MKLIVGLGNIGKEYEGTRHNAGFIALDEFAKLLATPKFKKELKFKALVTTGQFEESKFILAKPTTFMNLSGEAVAAICQFYKIPPTDILVIYDDLDLPVGKLRIRTNGSAGTHNGMKSIVQHLGTNEFPRLRLGIESRGETSPEKQDTSSFVLSKFNKEEQVLFQESTQKALKACEQWLLGENIELIMNKFN